MKILFIHSSARKIAGSEIVLLTLIDQAKENHDISALLPEEGIFCDLLRTSGIPVMVHKLSGFNRYNPFPFLKTLMVFLWGLLKVKPDLVHCSSLSPVQYVGPWCRILGIPLVTHVQCPYGPDDIRRYLPQLADRIILVAKNLTGSFPEHLHHKISIIYSSVDIPSIDRKKQRQAVTDEFGITSDLHCIGIFGQIIKRKGVDYFLYLMAQLKQTSSRFRAFIVGDDTTAFSKEMKALVSALGLHQQVIWTGFRDDVKSLMSAMDLVLVPSRKEGFGLVAVEALSVGTPVIAANTGGLTEIVEDAENGYLIEMSDVAKDAAQLKFLLDNPVVRKQMGEKGKRKVLKDFSRSEQVALMEFVYSSLLRERKPTYWLGRSVFNCLSIVQRLPALLSL